MRIQIYGIIIVFQENKKRKFLTVLKVRKEHNLKYKNIILSDEYTDSDLSPGML